MKADPKGNIILIKHHSDPEETDRCVYDISYFFIKAISGICELFSLNYEKLVKDFNIRLEKAASALDEANHSKEW